MHAMAEEALGRLKEQLQCAICLDTYTDPKQLQCHHTFCRKCLVRLTVRDQQGQLSLPCPSCRQVTPITESGVAGLQPAFQINNLLEIHESLKKIKLSPDRASSNDTNAYCSEHVDEELKVYCNMCEKLICLKCVIRNAQHHSHDYAVLDEAYEQYTEEILRSLEPVEDQLKTVDGELQQVDAKCDEISEQTAAVEHTIHHTINQFHEMLDARKTELVGQLHQIAERKLKRLGAQKDFLEIDRLQLRQCMDTVRESLQTGNKREVMKIKTTMAKQVEVLITGFQPNTFKLRAEADVVFSNSTDITAVCQNLGKLFESKKVLDPSQCFVTGMDLEPVMVGKKATAVLHIVDCNGDPYKNTSETVNCKLVSEITRVVVKPTLFSIGEGKYEISYEPTVKGKHRLEVKIGERHISGSPLSVLVKLPNLSNLGAPITAISDLNGPWGVAVNHKGEIIVSEHDEHCVSVFSPAGGKLRSFGTLGSGEGQFNNPRGIAVDKDGNILVTDYKNHRIQKFTTDGTFLAAVGTRSSWFVFPVRSPLKFRHPHAVAYNSSNDKIYVFDENDHVHVLNSDFTFHNIFGFMSAVRTPGPGSFGNDCGITCDRYGNVYVADGGYHRIQVFDAHGKFMRLFKTHSWGLGTYPSSIAVDNTGVVYVSEMHYHRVSVFTNEGSDVTSFGAKGNRLAAASNSSPIFDLQ